MNSFFIHLTYTIEQTLILLTRRDINLEILIFDRLRRAGEQRSDK